MGSIGSWCYRLKRSQRISFGWRLVGRAYLCSQALCGYDNWEVTRKVHIRALGPSAHFGWLGAGTPVGTLAPAIYAASSGTRTLVPRVPTFRDDSGSPPLGTLRLAQRRHASGHVSPGNLRSVFGDENACPESPDFSGRFGKSPPRHTSAGSGQAVQSFGQ